MDWNELIYKRHQEKVFLPDEVIPDDVIDSILQNFYETMPSKQGEFPYYIDVLDESDNDLRMFIYLKSFTTGADPITDFTNPQTLAPRLICISANEKKNNVFSYIETGLAAMHLSYAITNAGWEYGFCGCINDPHEVAEKLGHTDGKATQLILGVGKHNPTGQFWCPIGERYKKTGPNRNEYKPPFEQIIKKHYGNN